MKKIANWLAGTLLIYGAAFNPIEAFYPGEIDGDLGVGYRRDSLKWSIPGPGGVPDVLSELKWKDLESFCVSGHLTWEACWGLYFKASGDWASVQSGHVTDSDFASSGRRDRFAFSRSDADCSDLYDLSAGIGYRFLFGDDCWMLAPLVGYSLNEQRLNMEGGELELFLPNPRIEGPLDCLHSKYVARWTGPWAGVDIGYDWGCGIVTASFEYHHVHYRGSGHWNLRTDFLDDFIQKANGHGFVGSIGFHGRYQEYWYYGLTFNVQHFKTGSGSDSVTLGIDGAEVDFRGNFNSAHWTSFSVIGSLEYKF